MGYMLCAGNFGFFFGFTVSTVTTHLLELGMQMQLVPFPDIPVHFRSPQPRRSAMSACFSTLSQPHPLFSPVPLIFLDLLRWCCSLMVLQVAGSSEWKNLAILVHAFRTVVRTDWTRTDLPLSPTAGRNHDRHLRFFIPSL
ncbi:hypothetical protein EDB86DRAFT_3006002 [Lactarius hatsudake]|nr:hypothetical protein EDB86DRAFT_3006002 [Lactarius hatsudake]